MIGINFLKIGSHKSELAGEALVLTDLLKNQRSRLFSTRVMANQFFIVWFLKNAAEDFETKEAKKLQNRP